MRPGEARAGRNAGRNARKRNRELLRLANSDDPDVRARALKKLNKKLEAADAAAAAAELLNLGSSPELDDAAGALAGDMDMDDAADAAPAVAAGMEGAVGAPPEANEGAVAANAAVDAAGANVGEGAVAAPAGADEGEMPPVVNAPQGPVMGNAHNNPAAAAAGAAPAYANEGAVWDAIGTLTARFQALRSLHADKILNNNEFFGKAVPILERLVELYEDATGAFAPTLGRRRAFVEGKSAAGSALKLLRQLIDTAGAGGTSPVGNSGCAVEAGPRAAGLDPAVSTKPSLLKSPKYWGGGDSDAPIRNWLAGVRHWLTMSSCLSVML